MNNITTTSNKQCSTIGIDGCKGSWMVVSLLDRRLTIERYDSIAAALWVHKAANRFLIDIPIGLAESKEEAENRPEKLARKMLKGKGSSLFPAPFRCIARARSTSEAWDISKALNAGSNYMTMGIRSAVNEVDAFLQENEGWKNVLCESHPELCFALFNDGSPIMEKKSEEQGIEKRLEVLEKYGVDRTAIVSHPLFKKYGDDIVDASCLALVGRFAEEGKSTTIPPKDCIVSDATGIKMQMIIPKI